MKDPDGKSVTLRAFFDSVASISATLIFTGHSLGGALSPMLALLLYPKATKSKWANVFILATAGPTPGNEGLKKVFDHAYPLAEAPPYDSGGKQGCFAFFTHWNANYANIHDVVPRAWDGLDGLVPRPPNPLKPWPSFFGGGATLKAQLGLDTNLAVGDLKYRAGYHEHKTAYYVPALKHMPFPGQWGQWRDGDLYPPTWEAKTPPAELRDVNELAGSILNAHLPQYPFAFLGINAPPGGLSDEPGDL